MSAVVLDSSAWIEYLADKPKAAAIKPFITHPDRVIVPAIVLYEVYKKTLGAFGEDTAQTVAGRLSQSPVVPFDGDLAMQAAELSLSHKIAMADAAVLATARACGVELITLDADFEGLPGARVL